MTTSKRKAKLKNVPVEEWGIAVDWVMDNQPQLLEGKPNDKDLAYLRWATAVELVLSQRVPCRYGYVSMAMGQVRPVRFYSAKLLDALFQFFFAGEHLSELISRHTCYLKGYDKRQLVYPGCWESWPDTTKSTLVYSTRQLKAREPAQPPSCYDPLARQIGSYNQGCSTVCHPAGGPRLPSPGFPSSCLPGPNYLRASLC